MDRKFALEALRKHWPEKNVSFQISADSSSPHEDQAFSQRSASPPLGEDSEIEDQSSEQSSELMASNWQTVSGRKRTRRSRQSSSTSTPSRLSEALTPTYDSSLSVNSRTNNRPSKRLILRPLDSLIFDPILRSTYPGIPYESRSI